MTSSIYRYTNWDDSCSDSLVRGWG